MVGSFASISLSWSGEIVKQSNADYSRPMPHFFTGLLDILSLSNRKDLWNSINLSGWKVAKSLFCDVIFLSRQFNGISQYNCELLNLLLISVRSLPVNIHSSRHFNNISVYLGARVLLCAYSGVGVSVGNSVSFEVGVSVGIVMQDWAIFSHGLPLCMAWSFSILCS